MKQRNCTTFWKRRTQKAILLFFYIFTGSPSIFYVMSLILCCIPELYFNYKDKWMGKTLAGCPCSEGNGYWVILCLEASDSRVAPEPILDLPSFTPLAATRRRWWRALPASSPRHQMGRSVDTPPAGAANQRDPAGLEEGQTGTWWNSARTNAKSCRRKGKAPAHGTGFLCREEGQFMFPTVCMYIFIYIYIHI